MASGPRTSSAHPRTRGRDPPRPQSAMRSSGSPPHAGKGQRCGETNTGAPGLTPARGEGTRVPVVASSRWRAHPRTRGRDAVGSGFVGRKAGSPPHAGKGRLPPAASEHVGGLTPARGEGTARRASRRSRRWAHPRTRGRDPMVPFCEAAVGGSPPHAGKGRHHLHRDADDVGLTPARGEGTSATTRRPTSSRAHPRTRGRDWSHAVAEHARHGSLPHAGKGPRRSSSWATTARLTPARGEGTGVLYYDSLKSVAHPRTRGRDGDYSGRADEMHGSPPHAGKGLEGAVVRAPGLGLTPARGEGTVRPRRRRRRCAAHPRTRGRDPAYHGLHPLINGSPPHAGKGLGTPLGQGGSARLTPARGEGTVASDRRACRPRAHPRTRGRDLVQSGTDLVNAGSPPHAGKGPAAPAPARRAARLTPARGEGTHRRPTWP